MQFEKVSNGFFCIAIQLPGCCGWLLGCYCVVVRVFRVFLLHCYLVRMLGGF